MLEVFTEQEAILDFCKNVIKHPLSQISDLSPALKRINVLRNSI